MRVSEIITKELTEKFQHNRRSVAKIDSLMMIPRVSPKLSSKVHSPVKNNTPAIIDRPSPTSITQDNQQTNLNAKVDITTAPYFRLNDKNIMPEFSEVDKRILQIQGHPIQKI